MFSSHEELGLTIGDELHWACRLLSPSYCFVFVVVYEDNEKQWGARWGFVHVDGNGNSMGRTLYFSGWYRRSGLISLALDAVSSQCPERLHLGRGQRTSPIQNGECDGFCLSRWVPIWRWTWIAQLSIYRPSSTGSLMVFAWAGHSATADGRIIPSDLLKISIA